MTLQLPDEWKSHIDDIISSPGVTIVVGATDTGKSSFCTLLANHGLESGIPTAVVDGDMGQTDIGPPTTMGLGLVDSEIHTLSSLKPTSSYFIGSTTPVGHLLATAVGAKKLSDKASGLGKQLIIVDTTGLVQGAIARKLKTYKIELLNPRHIVAIQRTSEAEHFLKFFDTWENCTIHRIAPSPSARPKSRVLRTQRRAVRFYEYFHEGHTHQLPLESLATSGTWLHTGNPLETKYLKFAEKALGAPVPYGEIVDRAVYLIATKDYNRQGIDELQEYFRTKNVLVVPVVKYLNLLTGLLDSRLELLSLAIIRGIDFRAQTISVYTPLKSISPVRSIRLGVLKLRPDGTEIGRLRPGEV